MSIQSRQREQDRENDKPKQEIVCFPAKPGEFATIDEATLSPEQAKFLNGVRGEFTDAQAASRPGCGLFYIVLDGGKYAMQTPTQIRDL